jgi:hypothetical protein
MKKFHIGKRLLAGLLALIMIVSIIPMSVFAAVGDVADGKTGLDTNINTLDTISWPIKVYDYLNDGMLFEYASASHTSISDLNGDAYGGGAVMPSELFSGGTYLGNDYTVNNSSTSETDIYDKYAFSHWLKAQSGYAAASAQQGSGTKGAFKHLRLQPYKNYSDIPAIVLSDFYYDSSFYCGGTTSYAKNRVRYVALIYRTNVSNLTVTMGVTNTNGSNTLKNYNLADCNDPNGNKVKYDLTDEQRDEYKAMYVGIYADYARRAILSQEYRMAGGKRQAEMLEDAASDARAETTSRMREILSGK